MKQMKMGLVVVLALLAAKTIGQENEQNGVTLKGKLIDTSSGESLPFATIFVKSTKKETTSNVEGYFTLLDVPTDTSTIVVQYLGYSTMEVKLSPEQFNETIILELNPESTSLEEVVVSSQKEHIINASNKISSYSIASSQLTSLPSLGEKDIFRSLQLLPVVSGTTTNKTLETSPDH